MEHPGIGSDDAKALALSCHAARQLSNGESPAALQEHLLALGLPPDSTAELLRAATTRHVAVAMATEMLDHGAGVQQVRAKLMSRGLTAHAAAEVVEDIQELRSGVGADGAPSGRKQGKSANQSARAFLVLAGTVLFVALSVAACAWSFHAGGASGLGYVLGWVGQTWLLYLIFRECQPDALVLALFVPFFTWYFAYQRRDIAKIPWALSVVGLLVMLMALL
jgi:hypothetical protein